MLAAIPTARLLPYQKERERSGDHFLQQQEQGLPAKHAAPVDVRVEFSVGRLAYLQEYKICRGVARGGYSVDPLNPIPAQSLLVPSFLCPPPAATTSAATATEQIVFRVSSCCSTWNSGGFADFLLSFQQLLLQRCYRCCCLHQ